MSEILTHPNAELRKMSLEITKDNFGSDELTALESRLLVAMKEDDGIGIAAPQIGIQKRMIVVSMPHTGPTVFLNPKIIWTSDSMIEFEEGCLSVPGVYGMVDRHKKIKIEAVSIDGHPMQLDLKDLHAVVFQHEIDHLDGILFIDKAKRITRGKVE